MSTGRNINPNYLYIACCSSFPRGMCGPQSTDDTDTNRYTSMYLAQRHSCSNHPSKVVEVTFKITETIPDSVGYIHTYIPIGTIVSTLEPILIGMPVQTSGSTWVVTYICIYVHMNTIPVLFVYLLERMEIRMHVLDVPGFIDMKACMGVNGALQIMRTLLKKLKKNPPIKIRRSISECIEAFMAMVNI